MDEARETRMDASQWVVNWQMKDDWLQQVLIQIQIPILGRMVS